MATIALLPGPAPRLWAAEYPSRRGVYPAIWTHQAPLPMAVGLLATGPMGKMGYGSFVRVLILFQPNGTSNPNDIRSLDRQPTPLHTYTTLPAYVGMPIIPSLHHQQQLQHFAAASLAAAA